MTSQKLWETNEDDLVIAEGIGRARWNKNRTVIRVGKFRKFTDDEVAKLIERINGWSDVVKDISLTQIERVNDENWFIKGIRRNKSKGMIANGVSRPGRNDDCLCGSLKKFKNCCLQEIDS